MERFEKIMGRLASLAEILVSVLVMLAVISASAGLLVSPLFSAIPLDAQEFDLVLNQFLGIVVGIELVKMMVRRTPGSVIEVLIFAIARQLVVSHPSATSVIIGILCIAILFAVRKFLFVSSLEDECPPDDQPDPGDKT